jgi:hypothetical protein
MLIILFKLIFCTLTLVKILASDVVMEMNEFGILEGNQDSSLITRAQCEDREERLFSVNDETLEGVSSVVPNNQQSIAISNLEEPPFPQAFSSQTLEENGNGNFLSGLSTDRIVDHLVGPNRRHPFGNFLHSFILWDTPVPFSTTDSRFGKPTMLEFISAFLCLCISGLIIFIIILNTCNRCLQTYSQV